SILIIPSHALSVSLLSTAPAPPPIHTLSLHDALPISAPTPACSTASASTTTARRPRSGRWRPLTCPSRASLPSSRGRRAKSKPRSEEHTSELQSLRHLVCRLLLEKKKKQRSTRSTKTR